MNGLMTTKEWTKAAFKNAMEGKADKKLVNEILKLPLYKLQDDFLYFNQLYYICTGKADKKAFSYTYLKELCLDDVKEQVKYYAKKRNIKRLLNEYNGELVEVSYTNTCGNSVKDHTCLVEGGAFKGRDGETYGGESVTELTLLGTKVKYTQLIVNFSEYANKEVSKVQYKSCLFDTVDFSGSIFEYCLFENCEFINCTFKNAVFKNCLFKGATHVKILIEKNGGKVTDTF